MDSYGKPATENIGSDAYDSLMAAVFGDACQGYPVPPAAGECLVAPAHWPAPDEGWPAELCGDLTEAEIEALKADGMRGVGPWINYRRKKPWFDPGVDFREPVGHTFITTIFDLLPKKQGRGKRVTYEELYRRVRVILANGLRRYYYRTNPAVAHNRSNQRHPFAPQWPSGDAMSYATDLLEGAGLLALDVQSGKRMTSYYAVTDDLLDWAAECGVNRASLIKRAKDNDLIRLYGPKPKRRGKGAKRRGDRIDFQDTDLTRHLRAELMAYNEFLSGYEIGLALTREEEAEWAESLNDNDDVGDSDFRLPEMLQTDLCRVFNNGVVGAVQQAFDQGGRLYNGWWVNCPRRFRPRITIDGQLTVELDYSGLHVNMLYHERGMKCDGDPYAVPWVMAHEWHLGLEEGEYRPWVKAYTQALINCCKGGRPASAKIDKDIVVPPDLRPAELIRKIAKRHSPIKGAFRTGAGLRLQRLDSEIAMEVIATAMNEGWVALPVHDSFIATAEHKDRLLSIMEESYTKRMTFNIGVKDKYGNLLNEDRL